MVLSEGHERGSIVGRIETTGCNPVNVRQVTQMKQGQHPAAVISRLGNILLGENPLQGERLDFHVATIRDPKTGNVRMEVTIPEFQRHSLPKDLGLLIRAFSWGMTDVCREAGLIAVDPWRECCKLICEMEDFMGVI
jgi:hypothetical protein